jgi:hypothetical protein
MLAIKRESDLATSIKEVTTVLCGMKLPKHRDRRASWRLVAYHKCNAQGLVSIQQRVMLAYIIL